MSDKDINLVCNEILPKNYLEPGDTTSTTSANGPEPLIEDDVQGSPSVKRRQKASSSREVGMCDLKAGKIKSSASSTNLVLKQKKWNPIENIGEIKDASKGSRHPCSFKPTISDPIHEVLPLEIRWKVLKLFHESELLNLRLVSSSWRESVDSVLKVNVRIDGTHEDFKGQCGLPMQRCKLSSLRNPRHRSLFKSSCPEEVRVLHGICQINFREMILQWSNLSKLDICWRSVMKNMLFDNGHVMLQSATTQRSQVLPNLTSLKIEVLTNDNLGTTTTLRIITNLKNLTSCEYPRLRNFEIVFVGYRELHAQNRHMSILLPFIALHSNSLQTINFSLKYVSLVSYPPVHPRHILFCVPANIKYNFKTPYAATEGHLITTQLQRPSKDQHEDYSKWTELLENTRKLELAITTRFLSWTIRHFEYFAPTISQFSKFLRCIDLMNITMYDSGNHNTATQLDAKMFRHCSQLTQLRIYRAPIIFHEDEIDPAAEIINLCQLPDSLQELSVDGLPVASSDILDTIKNLTQLSSFHYFQSQVPRRNVLGINGINWWVLEAILKHQNLCFARVHATSLAQADIHALYDSMLRYCATEYGWNTNGITIGYMNMYEVMLIKGNEYLLKN